MQRRQTYLLFNVEDKDAVSSILFSNNIREKSETDYDKFEQGYEPGVRMVGVMV